MKNEGILGFADPDLIDSPPGSSGFPIGKNTPIIFSKAFANPNGKLSTEQWAATFLGHKKSGRIKQSGLFKIGGLRGLPQISDRR